MRPSAPYGLKNDEATYFGGLNDDNQQHGRGFYLSNGGFIHIHIGYYENGRSSTGHYITITSAGPFRVGERYMKEGIRRERGTQYNTDGTEEQFNF